MSSGDDGRTPSPTVEEVYQRIVHLITELEAVDPAQIGPETRLEQDLGMDSLSIVELQMAAEEAFVIVLPDDVAVPTVQAAVDAVVLALRRR